MTTPAGGTTPAAATVAGTHRTPQAPKARTSPGRWIREHIVSFFGVLALAYLFVPIFVVVLFSFNNQTISCINDQSLTKSYPTKVSEILHDEPKNGYRLKVDAKLLIDILQSFDKPFIVINLDKNTEPIHVEEAQKKAIVLPMRFDSK